jgi:hypothetical protein
MLHVWPIDSCMAVMIFANSPSKLLVITLAIISKQEILIYFDCTLADVAQYKDSRIAMISKGVSTFRSIATLLCTCTYNYYCVNLTKF